MEKLILALPEKCNLPPLDNFSSPKIISSPNKKLLFSPKKTHHLSKKNLSSDKKKRILSPQNTYHLPKKNFFSPKKSISSQKKIIFLYLKKMSPKLIKKLSSQMRCSVAFVLGCLALVVTQADARPYSLG